MASLSLLILALSTLLAATEGFLIGYDELAGFVNVSDTVHAQTISDYYAQINGGGITAYTLNLTGALSGATSDFGLLYATNTTTTDLTALNTHTPTATFETLAVTGNATFHSPVTVEGELKVSGTSHLGDLDVLSLTVTNQTHVDGILFAQSNLQITEDLIVRGNTRVFGDLLVNASLTVGVNLEVHDQAQILEDLMIANNLHTMNLTVEGTASLAHLKVSGWVNVTGSADVGMDLHANNGDFDGSLSAHDANIMENFDGKGTLNVNGYLKAVKTASFAGDFNAALQSVQSWISVDGDANLEESLTVLGHLTVDVDISSSGTLTAVDAMFSTLSVDTATLESLTATFVTATNLVSTDATIGKSFMSGMTTLETLVVKGSTTLTDAAADQVAGQTVNAGSATSATLTVTEHGEFETVQVKTLIVAGSPTRTDHTGSFESGFTDMLEFVDLVGTEGNITNLDGSNLMYVEIVGVNLTAQNLTSEFAHIESAEITEATIQELLSESTSIDDIWVTAMNYATLEAVNGEFQRVDALDTRTDYLNASQATIDSLTSINIDAEHLIATTATVSSLYSEKAWLNTLTTTNGTITNLWSTTTTATALSGTNITYDTATVTRLSTQSGVTNTFDVRQTIASGWLWARTTNFTTLDSKSLRVTEAAWAQNLTLHDNLMVEGETTLEMGFISGPAVVSSLDVVESSLLVGLSATGTSFLTDLMVKRVTITDDFQANEAQLGATTVDTLEVTGETTVLGEFNVTGDSNLGGNLVVVGTTQFQTGSFSRIGTALITTTDMEAFNLNAAEGTFGEIETSDFLARRAVNFDRSIGLAPLRGDISGATHSLFIQIAPTTFPAQTSGFPSFDVNTLSYLHTGNASIDALVVTSSTDPSVAALRFKGDGSVDLMDGDILFDDLNVGGGVEFENENNIAYPRSSVTLSLVLAQGQEAPFYSYSTLQDRDLSAPGSAYTPTRFQQPGNAGDLLTLTPGHYRISGNVYFAPSAPANSSIVAISQASVSAWMGTQSNSSQAAFWTTSCVANFNLVASSSWGGSCSFADVLVVLDGETATLRTSVSWPFSSSPSIDTLTVSPKSIVQVAEYFERSSEGL